ncbi:MAG TPA: SusC/RagA family TonB-linked outer membrane protein [Chitinophaga sp.]|uniref:SusC/RagA family TonB-linked outer membrane protein n=1 Tax=Chitinophaga sp. TaxID=1869181 RepID=UPI002DC04F85|nr:SusC/RagA family TonB-linked outer membrane protein [Chitinophaga sp.]HEU4553252.1 SusC/RagA family TonB-linked outer membrane protein [Chitinophaga sp.]
MKLTFVLLTVAFMGVHATGLSQSVTLSGRHLSLKQVFTTIEQQTGYVVFSNRGDLDDARPVSLDVQNMPLVAFLDVVMKDQPLSYIIEGKTIVLSLKPAPPAAGAVDTASAARISISGRVMSDNNEVIPRATISIKRIGKVILADDEGYFSINDVEDPFVFEISAVGYAPMTLRVSNGKIHPTGLPMHGSFITTTNGQLIVQLGKSVSPLDEVQVIAYGQTTRRMGLGDVTTIRAEEIARQPVNNVLLALQGRVPGMQINMSNGSLPGAVPQVTIRGINSISAGTSPLYILNGIPLREYEANLGGPVQNISTLLNINPADIESIDVLKDAEATAIYGSRGANGVVLITTKKGKAGKTSFSVNAYTGVGTVARRLPFMDVHQYNAMRREAFANDGHTPTAGSAPDLFTWDTLHTKDWQEEFIGGTAVTHDINASISGGNANTTFLINGGYHKDGTVFPGNLGADRKSIRLNIDHHAMGGKLGVNASVAATNTYLGLISGNLMSFVSLPPSYPMYNEDGTPNFNGPSGYPLAYLMQPADNTTNTYNGNIAIRYSPVKHLNLKLTAGLDNAILDQTLKFPSASQANNADARLNIRNSNVKTWIAEPQADYTIYARKHTLKVLVGGTWQKTTTSSLGANGTGFTNDALLDNISSAASIYTYNYSSSYAYNSFFSRISYNWNQEYLANLSFRRDGSSRFGPGKRFGNFGAAGVGWIFTQNGAVKKALPFMSFGKLRASYGINGNDQINDYGYITTYASGQPYQSNTLFPTNLANPDYRWEENRKLEAALETGFKDDRFLFSVAWFRNRTNNQLINYVISPQSGYGSYPANFPALLQNTGWEFQATSSNIATKNFTWRTLFNFSISRNKLLDFPNIEQTSYSSQYFVGQPLTVRQAYRFLGLSNKGVPVLDDMNKNGAVSSDDRYIIGSNNPLFGGMSNEFSYKGISLSFFIEYTHISNFDNSISASRVGAIGVNPLTQVLDRWQKPGDEAFTSRPKFTTSAATYNARFYSQSDIFWTNYNIVRLRNLSISYDLPKAWLQKAHLRQTQVYMHAQNLWVADSNKYRYDPESGNLNMPPLRTFTFGINCTL